MCQAQCRREASQGQPRASAALPRPSARLVLTQVSRGLRLGHEGTEPQGCSEPSCEPWRKGRENEGDSESLEFPKSTRRQPAQTGSLQAWDSPRRLQPGDSSRKNIRSLLLPGAHPPSVCALSGPSVPWVAPLGPGRGCALGSGQQARPKRNGGKSVTW